MPTSLVIVQNAAQRRDVGVATGAMLFLRSMGAAFGSTLVGTLLAAASPPGSRRRAPARPASTSGRCAGTAASRSPPAVRESAMAALAGGFHVAFIACAALAGVAFLTCLGMRDLPLKSGARG